MIINVLPCFLMNHSVDVYLQFIHVQLWIIVVCSCAV